LTLPPGTLAAARIIAKSHRATIALGRDPAIEAKMDLDARREAHARSVSVEAALTLYRQHALAGAKTKLESKRRRLRVLERAIEPFAGRAIASIGRVSGSSASTRFKSDRAMSPATGLNPN
jgi:hypothetical protein